MKERQVLRFYLGLRQLAIRLPGPGLLGFLLGGSWDLASQVISTLIGGYK